MLFNSTDYALFLALVLGGYWLPARRAALRFPRLSFVLVASSAFYMAWNPWYLALILAVWAHWGAPQAWFSYLGM